MLCHPGRRDAFDSVPLRGPGAAALSWRYGGLARPSRAGLLSKRTKALCAGRDGKLCVPRRSPRQRISPLVARAQVGRRLEAVGSSSEFCLMQVKRGERACAQIDSVGKPRDQGPPGEKSMSRLAFIVAAMLSVSSVRLAPRKK